MTEDDTFRILRRLEINQLINHPWWTNKKDVTWTRFLEQNGWTDPEYHIQRSRYEWIIDNKNVWTQGRKLKDDEPDTA